MTETISSIDKPIRLSLEVPNFRSFKYDTAKDLYFAEQYYNFVPRNTLGFVKHPQAHLVIYPELTSLFKGAQIDVHELLHNYVQQEYAYHQHGLFFSSALNVHAFEKVQQLIVRYYIKLLRCFITAYANFSIEQKDSKVSRPRKADMNKQRFFLQSVVSLYKSNPSLIELAMRDQLMAETFAINLCKLGIQDPNLGVQEVFNFLYAVEEVGFRPQALLQLLPRMNSLTQLDRMNDVSDDNPITKSYISRATQQDRLKLSYVGQNEEYRVTYLLWLLMIKHLPLDWNKWFELNAFELIDLAQPIGEMMLNLVQMHVSNQRTQEQERQITAQELEGQTVPELLSSRLMLVTYKSLKLALAQDCRVRLMASYEAQDYLLNRYGHNFLGENPDYQLYNKVKSNVCDHCFAHTCLTNSSGFFIQLAKRLKTWHEFMAIGYLQIYDFELRTNTRGYGLHKYLIHSLYQPEEFKLKYLGHLTPIRYNFTMTKPETQTLKDRLACYKSKIVGLVQLHDEYDLLNISNILVAPEHQRQGLANHLLYYAQISAQAQNFEKLSLEVREGNTAARLLYEAFGFKDVYIRPEYYSYYHKRRFITESAVIYDKEIEQDIPVINKFKQPWERQS